VNVFLLLILSHLAADFGLQIYGIGRRKYGLNKYMLAHILIVSTAFFLPALIYFPFGSVFTITVAISVTHLLTDIVKAWIYRKYKISAPDHMFWAILGADQAIHIIAIYGSLLFLLN